MRRMMTTTTRLPASGRIALASGLASALSAVLSLSLLGGCASRLPGGSPSFERDGPEAHPPANLMQVPDAEPKPEPIRSGGANKPYVVSGQRYEPMTQDLPYREQGLASWYGRLYHGKPTANGELYDMYAMSAAHPTLPIPSYARIRNPANGREVVVRVNDRGPFRSGRIVDLSYTAALKLDVLRGTAPVELERITADDIRTGAWRRDPASVPQPLLAAVGAAPAAARSVPPPDPTTSLPGVAAPAVAAPAVAMPAVDAPPSAAANPPAPGYWVQLGAFRQHDGALTFQKQVEAQVGWLTPLLTVIGDADLFKLQAGPYPSREEARDAAGRLRAALQLVPVIVERR